MLRGTAMKKVKVLTAMRHTARAVSWALVIKSMVGVSVGVLALFGVTLHLWGINPSPLAEGGAAGFGALIGLLLALRA